MSESPATKWGHTGPIVSPGRWYSFFKEKNKSGDPDPEEDREAKTRTEGREDRVLVCRDCGHVITTQAQAIEVESRHRHTFFNPHGILFEIGCFASAPGCFNNGVPTTEFAWFTGFAWRFSSCARCDRHLGWHFQSDNKGFWGLILNRLTETERENKEA